MQIDPLSGTITASVFVGSEPGNIALSDDGRYLYVGLNGANAVRRVAILSNERSRAVKFIIDKGKVEVTSSSSEFGEAREQLPVDYTAAAMTISFNAQYVLDFLNVVETDIVSLSLKDEVSQAVMKPVGAEGYDYTYVIMPMRI